ncbi:MAG: LysR family transcriptional regulator [Neisseriaceae bacterium]|nr:LysR family transcriptional regulator [Neisseriaceae bacterium]MBP6863197.1 LysR family transcriptional regulator [Neisseriaceae bacterium]
MVFSSETIRVFLAVLDHGSFSAAARALGRVPSAISMSIAQLEAELDLMLFDRQGREPVPTDVARALASKARAVNQNLQDLNGYALALHKGLETELTMVIAPELLMVNWSTPLIALEHEYPMLKVNVVTAPQEDALALLQLGEAQLAIVFERGGVDERESWVAMGQESMVAVIAANHKTLAEGKVGRLDQAALRNIRQISLRSRFVGAVAQGQLLSHTVWHVDAYLAALCLVKSGLGWALLPEYLVADAIATGSLINLEWAGMNRQSSLCVNVVWSKMFPQGLGAKRYVELIQTADEGLL